jgi:NADPH2:quinone reductase
VRAFVVHDLCGPAGGTVADAPEPTGSHPWADGQELLIEVHAAGVAFPDVLQSYGRYQHGAPPPYVAGGEVAGVVLRAAPGLSFAPGDRVCGLTVWGALAPRALGIPRYTVKLPPAMDFARGAALYLNYATAWFSLFRTGVRTGQSVLVHGAAGGVGTATIQMVRARGGQPIAVVSDDSKVAAARSAGAEEVLRSGDDWVAAARDLTGGQGADVVIDPVGGDRFVDSLRSLDVGGVLAVVGFASGTIPTVKVNRLLLRDLSVVGVALDPYARRHPEILPTLNEDLQRMAADGALDPLVGHRLTLEDAAEALRLIDERRATGKVVVDIVR